MTKPSKVSGTPRAAVIGSGFGGLALAIRLQSAGVQTVLFEAHEQPGGRARTFTRDGFTFDAGPTIITIPSCLEELFELSGRQMSDTLKLLPVKPFYRLAWPESGDTLDYGVDLDETLRQFRKLGGQGDVDGYLRFLEYSKANFEAGYTELVAEAFLKPMDMAAVAPKMAWLRADRPVYSSVSKHVKDERLRQALSFHTLLIGGNPFETSSIYTLIHYLERQFGVFFPEGGTGALVKALANLFEALGGELRLGCPVYRIEAEEEHGKNSQPWMAESRANPKGCAQEARNNVHFVTSAQGQREPFDLSVSNADLHTTYSHLLGHDSRALPMRRRLERMKWSMSLFLIYFGVDKVYDDIAHHTILFGPRYKELLQEIFHGSKLPGDFSLYLHAPTVTDPSLAPEGCTTFYVLSPVPHLGNAPIDWERVGPQYADKILRYLERHMLPDLRQHIVTQSTFSPQDFKKELGAFMGNGFSVAPLLTQSAYFRPHNRDPRIPGMYFVGAGTHPGAGVPGVVNSAKATARVILDDLGLS